VQLRWFNPAGGWVWPAGAGPVTYFFPTDPLGPQSYDLALQNLFAPDAALLPQDHDGFRAYQVTRPETLEARLRTLSVPSLDWPSELSRLPPPALPLLFGERFALLGVELERDDVPPGGELRLVSYWEVLAADPAPVLAFVHLTSDGQDVWGQQDWLDVRPEGLQPGDRFAQVHAVPVSTETLPGSYHLQLGLYNPDTLVRLPIGEEGADRVWVGQINVTE
jgi:hypothetical protein